MFYKRESHSGGEKYINNPTKVQSISYQVIINIINNKQQISVTEAKNNTEHWAQVRKWFFKECK